MCTSRTEKDSEAEGDIAKPNEEEPELNADQAARLEELFDQESNATSAKEEEEEDGASVEEVPDELDGDTAK